MLAPAGGVYPDEYESRLPQELIDYVLAYLAADKVALTNTALVHSTWLSTSYSLLFRRFSILIHTYSPGTYGGGDLRFGRPTTVDNAVTLLDRSPLMRSYVKSVNIQMLSTSGRAIFSSPRGPRVEAGALLKLVDMFTELETLATVGIFTLVNQTLGPRSPRRPRTLERLVFRDLTAYSEDLHVFITQFHRISSLTLVDPEVHSFPSTFTTHREPRVLGLHTLRIVRREFPLSCLDHIPLDFDLSHLKALDIDDPRGTSATEDRLLSAPLCELVRQATNVESLRCSLLRCAMFSEKCMSYAFRHLRCLHLSVRMLMAPEVEDESVVSKASAALHQFRSSPLEEFTLQVLIHVAVGREQLVRSLELLEWRQLDQASSVFSGLRALCFHITMDATYAKDMEEGWRRGSKASAQLKRILQWKVIG